ncbi:hypothetical protein EIP91_001140 [Steccherinum ochraceum]|uniref:Cytochrome P450 n=1 Tax=Steccherinum ochraceum TaxID=92696 RepID=A0A4R0RIG2_9APHY|nr:hypothetical protein EIP91_001140 [Steccherinum ochraceum]
MFESINGLDVFVTVIAVYIVYRSYHSSSHGPLPPGPKGLPLIGNLDLPQTYFWTKYAEIGQTYGDIWSTSALGRRFVILNSRRHLIDMLEKRHAIYDDRHDVHMITEIAGWNQATVFMPPNAEWKDQRKHFSRMFGTRTLMAKWQDTQMWETRRFVRNVMRKPEALEDHIRYWAGAMILKIVYGYDIKPGHDPLVEIVDEAMSQWIYLSRPGAYMVDFFPWLAYIPSWFPGATFKREGKKFRKTLDDLIHEPFKIVQAQMNQGTAPPSYVSNILSADDYTPDQEWSVKASAATVGAAGADTTATQVHGFFLVMLLWPDAQRKAQEEIDRVVGTDRLPTFSDRDRLPYVEALLKECLRLHTSVPISGPRRALQDDVQDGYFIPKGSLIQPNPWAIAHDPELYPDPLNLVPERWLVDDPPPHPREYIFGFGRRICPGMIMADTSFWIASVLTLALLDINPTKDSPKAGAFTHGEGGLLDGKTICHPKPFSCSITPRSRKAEELILAVEHEEA